MSLFTVTGYDYRVGIKAISHYEKSAKKPINLRKALCTLGLTGARCGIPRETMEATMERCFKAGDFEKARKMWFAGCAPGRCRGIGGLFTCLFDR